MRVILHILHFKIKSFSTLSRELKAATIVKNLGTLIVFGAFAFIAYYGTRISTDYLLDTARLGLFLLHRFLSMLLLVFFLSVNVGNMIVSYASFYRSPETAFYFTKPLSHTSLFLIKFLDNFLYSSSTFFLIAVAVLAGYGAHFGMPAWFYVQTMVLMLVPFMLIAACLAALLLLLLMRFVDVIGMRKVVVALVLIHLLVLYGFFSVSNPMSLVAAVWQYFPRVDEYYGFLDPPFAKFLPNHWIAESLYWTMRGNNSVAWSYTILLLVVTACVCSLTYVVAKKSFYKSWLASLSLRKTGESQNPILRIFSLTKPSLLEPQTSVLLRKEFLQFVREPSQWIHLGTIAILTLTFLFSVAMIDLKQSLPFFQTMSYMMLLIFNAFLIASIALRFVYPSVSVEGSSFWKILSGPVSRRKVFWLKFAVYLAPLIVISEAMILISHQSLMAYTDLVLFASLIMLIVAFTLVALSLGAGAFFADYKERNPIKVASSQSATITFLISMLYMIILVAVVFIPINKYFGFILRGFPFHQSSMYYAIGLFLGLSGIMGCGALLVGVRSIERDF